MLDPQGMIDPRVVEATIQRGIESQIERAVRVECPTGIVPEKGAVFYCDIKIAEANPSKARVTQQDDEGGFFWEIVNPGPLPNEATVGF